jgi:ketosteroid isomerase-like protein
MNKLVSACLACMLSAAAFASAPAMAAPSDEAQIKALEARFVAAVKARNLDAIMKTYSADVFVFDVSPPRQYVGAAAYREDWKGFLTGVKGPVGFDVTNLVVSAEGTIGYGRSIQHVTGVDPKGAKVDLTVRVTDVYRKTGGAWRVVQEHVSVPVNLDTGKADLSSKP